MTDRRDPDDRYALPAEQLDLEHGYRLAWCIDPDGEARPWIMAPLCSCCEQTTRHGDAGPTSAPHDQPGPLPDETRRRLDAVIRRCSRPTATGRPCRTPVPQPGGACHWHTTKADR